MTHRKDKDDTKTGAGPHLRDEHGGNLLTVYVVSGVKEA